MSNPNDILANISNSIPGGGKPMNTAFTPQNSTDISKLADEINRLNRLTNDQAQELRALQGVITLKDEQLARYYEIIQALIKAKS